MTEVNTTPSLKGFQKAYLRGLGQRLPARVHVGKNGVGDSLEREIDRFLTSDELVKVRFGGAAASQEGLPEELAKRTGSVLAGTAGHTALLYRPHPDSAQRKIHLPERT